MSEQPNTVIADASLALKWVIDELDSPQAQLLLKQWLNQKLVILAPDLLIYEATNILHKRVCKGELTLRSAMDAFSLLMQGNLSFVMITNETLSLKALNIAKRFKLLATYDAHYLALTKREQCEFWTADERLYNSVKEQLSWVRLMSDLASISVAD